MKNKKGINGVKAVNGTHGRSRASNGHNGHGQNGHSNGHNGIHAANGNGKDKSKIYRPTEKEPFMNERQKEYFRAEARDLAGRHPERGQGHPAAPAGREPEPPGPGRPRLLGNRPGHRASRPRPPAQADLQDRCCTAPDRRRHLRLLRGDRRADRPQAPGGPPDRHAVGRGPGAPRAPRADLPRRLSCQPALIPFSG